MAYSNEVINKVLVRLAKDIDVNLISEEFNISKTTIYKWKKANKDLIEVIKCSLQIRELIRNKKYEEALYLKKVFK